MLDFGPLPTGHGVLDRNLDCLRREGEVLLLVGEELRLLLTNADDPVHGRCGIAMTRMTR